MKNNRQETRPSPLDPAELYRRCDPGQLGFRTTAELEDLEQPVGQDRALEALRFGIGIRREGYNLFVLGPSGIGKYTVVRQYLERQAAQAPPPDDWCYVNNFEEPARPLSLRLPAGRGQALRQDMTRLVEDLRSAIPAAFETEEYQTRVKEIEEGFKERREQALNELARESERHGLALLRTPGGFAFAPQREGKVIKPEDYEKLSDDEKKRIEETVAMLQEKLESILRHIPQWQREARERLKALEQEVGMFAVGSLIEALKKKYADLEAVVAYLDAVQADIMANLNDFRTGEEAVVQLPGLPQLDRNALHRRYSVNLLVDNSTSQGAPVIYEPSPLYQNLVGRVEHQAQMGALITDFTLVRPGALHRANGGYLILDAAKVLLQPHAWEGLKQVLKSQEVRIQSLGEIYSLVSTVSLEPQPIPVDLKVVLLGDRLLYYLLMAYDPEFAELFKVAADFEEEVDRTPENNLLYARLIATVARREQLLPLDVAAVARILEHGARLAEDAEKLTTHLLDLVDLLRESDHWARQHGHEVVERADVQAAIDAQIRRLDRVRQKTYEHIQRNIVLIDTDGEQVGQVNGLSVLQLGNFAFGQPTRITANTRLGEGEVVDIEREVELGGAIHSKGVLILSSFLASRYAANLPLSLSASLVFEQSYGVVEGDSASVAELCALISSLARVPIRQCLAVTGSVNQHGQVQAIGGVNEKIEGFFDICRERGLNGRHGVLIPRSNVVHLMLRQDVVDAVREGLFHVYPVTTVDEAIELLTGQPAGTPDGEGRFPEGTVNRGVADRLEELSHIRQEYSKGAEHEEHHDDRH
ncbi:MAG TPA: ATP-dependent protease [Gammaproteobacteria bacterium]|nr:ATP-dependent protease [Gammaproteobacteria bacterium]